MDILVSSNLERLLFELSGHDSAQTAGYMQLLQKHGKYKIGTGLRNKMQQVFYGDCCTDAEGRAALGGVFARYGYLMDTHTAVAYGVYQKYVRNTGDEAPTVIVSTASPYKFADAVLRSIGAQVPEDDFERLTLLSERSGTPVPAPIAGLQTQTVRFNDRCGKDEMKEKVWDLLDLSR